jgi:hypothetical protein
MGRKKMWADLRDFIRDWARPARDVNGQAIDDSFQKKRRLRERLNNEWHNIADLRTIINETEANAQKLLESIGARSKPGNMELGPTYRRVRTRRVRTGEQTNYLSLERAERPPNPNLQFWIDAEQHFDEKDGKIYLRDGSKTVKRLSHL